MSTIPSNAMPHAGGTTTNSDDSRKATQPTGSRDRDSTASFSRQPDRQFEGDQRRQGSGSLMDKARDHKTGIAVGIAVGAIAAAAVPLMFSGKKKSSDRQEVDYSAELYTAERGQAGSDTGRSDFEPVSTTGVTSGAVGSAEVRSTADRKKGAHNL